MKSVRDNHVFEVDKRYANADRTCDYGTEHIYQVVLEYKRAQQPQRRREQLYQRVPKRDMFFTITALTAEDYVRKDGDIIVPVQFVTAFRAMRRRKSDAHTERNAVYYHV